MTRLIDLIAKWRLWATTADQTENGWETDFPEWGSLAEAALDTMRIASPDDLNAREAVDAVWQLDQEDQDLADLARPGVAQPRDALLRSSRADRRARGDRTALIGLGNAA